MPRSRWPFGVNWGVPEVFLGTAGSLFSGLSILALISALLQLLQSRMALPVATQAMSDDPNVRIQRQMAVPLPVHLLDLRRSCRPACSSTGSSRRCSRSSSNTSSSAGEMFPLFGGPRVRRGPHTAFPVSMPPPVDPATRPPKSALVSGADNERRRPTRPFATRSAAARAAEGDDADECVQGIHRKICRGGDPPRARRIGVDLGGSRHRCRQPASPAPR